MIEVIGILGSVGFGVTAIALALRNGGLQAEIKEADLLRKAAEAALKVHAAEAKDEKLRAQSQIDSLIEELERLEDERLKSIEKIKDPDERIRRRRGFVGSVLSQASDRSRRNDDSGMPEEPSS